MPELSEMATNPTGYDPATLAAMNTQNMQSAGGTQAGAVGQGALEEGRTNNPGSARAAIASSSRGAGEQLSKRGLGVQTGNAELKNQQQNEGIAGLEGVYGTSTGAVAPNLNASAENTNANTNATNAGWDWAKYVLDPAMKDAAGTPGG